MKSAATRTPAERQALNEAARWHTRLHDEAATPEDQQAWQHWHSAHPSHQWAWQTVQAVSQRLARIPTPVAMQALAQPPMARRAALRGVALGLSGCAATWLAWQASPWQALGASYHTATGERQQLGLPDGSELALDTATAVDEHFDANDRRLSLHSGRIQISTRPDLHQRPFSVQTPQGSVLALGTQFTVQVLDAQHTRVAVQEKSVRVQPTHGEARLLVAGQQMDFSSTEALPPQPAHLAQASWRDGGLIALDMPLAELVQELARYRPGYLGCAPEVAHLQVSGAFTLDDTDRALAALAASFAVQVHYRTRYWVRVEAA